jgi:hypothetical protein
MIQLMKSEVFDGAIIRVTEPKTGAIIATLYANYPKEGVPGTFSIDSAKGISPDYTDEISSALTHAWRVTKGYITVS